jgi:PAS domain S-box-containing protein
VQDAVIAIDDERRVTYLNQGAVEQYGLDPQNNLGHSLSELYRNEWLDCEDEKAAFASLASSGSWRGESVHVKRNGERIVVESSVGHIRDAAGRNAGTLMVIRDVSERRRLQAQRERLQAQSIEDREAAQELVRAVERERAVLDTITEHTHVQIAYLDRQFNFVRVNSAYARDCGYSASDLVGRGHFELFPHVENQAIFEHVRDTGQAAVFRAKPFVYPDRPELGTTYWDWTLVPVMGAGDHVEGLVLSLSDVTERERNRAEREAQWTRQGLLVDVSKRILEQRTTQGVLQHAVDAARKL